MQRERRDAERRTRSEAREGFRGDRPADPLGDGERRLDVGVGQENRELVTADSCGDVADALVRPQAARDQLDQRVAHLVPAQVVHRLQPVAVAEHDRNRQFVVRPAPQLLLEPLFEPTPVEQAGQLIGDCGPLLAPERRRHVDQGSGVLRKQRRCLEPLLGRGQGPRVVP